MAVAEQHAAALAVALFGSHQVEHLVEPQLFKIVVAADAARPAAPQIHQPYARLCFVFCRKAHHYLVGEARTGGQYARIAEREWRDVCEAATAPVVDLYAFLCAHDDHHAAGTHRAVAHQLAGQRHGMCEAAVARADVEKRVGRGRPPEPHVLPFAAQPDVGTGRLGKQIGPGNQFSLVGRLGICRKAEKDQKEQRKTGQDDHGAWFFDGQKWQ